MTILEKKVQGTRPPCHAQEAPGTAQFCLITPFPFLENEDKEEEVEARGDKVVPLTVVEFLNAIEEPLKEDNLPLEKGKTIYTSLLGTASDLAPEENVKVIIYDCYVRT